MQCIIKQNFIMPGIYAFCGKLIDQHPSDHQWGQSFQWKNLERKKLEKSIVLTSIYLVLMSG